MTLSRCRREAALFLSTLAVACCALAVPERSAAAQTNTVDVPAHRQLEAGEPLIAPGNNGADFSANVPSLSGLNLLASIPAPTTPRLGYFIQAQCTAGVTVALDNEAGSLAPTIVILAGAAAEGGQGGSMSMTGMPHTGRIRIYSSAPDCQMAARSW